MLSLCFTITLLAQGPTKALDFDGVDDYVLVSNHTSLQISNNITLESWIKFSADFTPFSTNYHQGLIDKGNYSLKFDFQSARLVFELDDAAATSWSMSRNGGESMIESMVTYNGRLYAGQGNGAGAGDVLAYGGSSWSTNYDGFQESIHTLAVYDGRLYAGQGSSTGDGDVLVYDGSTWTTSINGSQESIHSLAVYNDRLYAGQGSGTGDGDIGVFDGTNWSLIYNGLQESILSLAVYNGRLYAGQGSGTGDGDILEYDGSSWGISYDGSQESIYALAVYNGKLYAGQGSGTGDGDILVNDGSSWSIIYDGSQESIYSLAVYNGKLYAGQGSGTGDGDIMVYDGNTWGTSYNGSQEGIHSMAEYNGRIYAGQGSGTGDGDIGVFGNNVILESTQSNWIANQWYHVVALYDGSNMRIGINGIQDAFRTSSFTIETSNTPLLIGYDGSNNYVDAHLDEIRIWNLALNGTQVRSNMCRGLQGNEAGLAGYWRFDEGSGTTANDETANNNDGTLMNMTSVNWVWSGAPIGDTSAYDYTGTVPGDFSASIAHGDGDNLTATGDGGTLTGIQVYRVDANSLRQDAAPPSGWTLDPLRYWGVFVVGTNPTYTVTYNYDGHPGIENENDLGLAFRDDHSDNSWADVGATLDTDANILVRTAQTGTEYTLGSMTGDNSLPVELSIFTANESDGQVLLFWRTESERGNLGFILKRSFEEGGPYTEISSFLYNENLRGHFNSNTAHEYSFMDEHVNPGFTYWYKLIDVDINGMQTEHGPISATPGVSPIPNQFVLYPAYPNPFNPRTIIKYNLPVLAKVNLKIYNILGQEVLTLVNEEVEPGYYELSWDGRDNLENQVASGVYIYRMIAETPDGKNRFVMSKRMNLLR